jgi:hypothetical protein
LSDDKIVLCIRDEFNLKGSDGSNDLLETKSNKNMIRLPEFIVPSTYELELEVNLDSFKFGGNVSIDLNVCIYKKKKR